MISRDGIEVLRGLKSAIAFDEQAIWERLVKKKSGKCAVNMRKALAMGKGSKPKMAGGGRGKMGRGMKRPMKSRMSGY